MRVRTPSAAIYTLIAWLPLLAVVVGVAYILGLGLFQLESISFGTEFLIGNDETTNLPKPIGGSGGLSDEELLLNALNSGDEARMAAALDQVGGDQAALSGTAG